MMRDWEKLLYAREMKTTREYQLLLTKRKIHEANETEPKTPESASWAVSGTL
jgi:hypothetical protein